MPTHSADHPGAHAPHHDYHHDHHGDSASIAQLLDLDAEVLRNYLFDATNWVRALLGSSPRKHIVDVGAGTGTGTLALASRFPRAHILAVDLSAQMLARVNEKAALWGVAERVTTAQFDLTAPWPVGTPADLIWAASVMHEMRDPEVALLNAFRALAPGGLLVVVEMDGPPRFLPDDIGFGTPGFEHRVHAALASTRDAGQDHPDWTEPLDAAGFHSVEKRTFVIDLPSPQPAATGRYAAAYVGRIAPALTSLLSDNDRATLAILLDDTDPRSLARRADLTVRATRTAWAARRP
jgi:SAM-dependent methyltransferase